MKFRFQILALVFAVVLVLCVIPASAQSGGGNCGGDPNCVADYEFTSNAESFFDNEASPQMQWLPKQDWGWLWWATSATGVIKAPYPAVRTYLNVGHYIIRARVSSYSNNFIVLRMNQVTIGGSDASWTMTADWAEYTTSDFYVVLPGYQQFSFDVYNPGANSYGLYVDDFQILSDTNLTRTPTPTVGAGTPTPVVPPTSTATPPAATQLPLPTQVCQSAAPTMTPTNMPVTYGITPTATAAPTIWAYLENFDSGKLNSFFEMANDTNFQTDLGRNNSANSMLLPISTLPSLPDSVLVGMKALVFTPDKAMPGTIYLNAWAQTKYVPVGVTAYVDVFVLDGGTWSLVQSVPISWGQWYPFQVTINSSAGTAVAIGAHRSDGVDFLDYAYVDLDDLYLYASPGDEPYCNGSYPGGTLNVGGTDQNGNANASQYFVVQPSDRDCPTDQIVPNNLWGSLLSGMIRFLDVNLAPWPTHHSGQTSQLMATLISSPIITFATIACIFLDLRVPLLVAGVILAGEGVRSMLAIYHLIKSLLPW